MRDPGRDSLSVRDWATRSRRRLPLQEGCDDDPCVHDPGESAHLAPDLIPEVLPDGVDREDPRDHREQLGDVRVLGQRGRDEDDVAYGGDYTHGNLPEYADVLRVECRAGSTTRCASGHDEAEHRESGGDGGHAPSFLEVE